MEENKNEVQIDLAGNVWEELEEIHKLYSTADERKGECIITYSAYYTIICC